MSSSWSLASLAAGLQQCWLCKVLSISATTVVCYSIANESFTYAELLTVFNAAVGTSISYTSLQTKCVSASKAMLHHFTPMTLVKQDASSSCVPLFTLQQRQHTSVMGKMTQAWFAFSSSCTCVRFASLVVHVFSTSDILNPEVVLLLSKYIHIVFILRTSYAAFAQHWRVSPLPITATMQCLHVCSILLTDSISSFGIHA